ncbi:MAG: MEDS domain-containing protein [Deltaproteobacteria bacterium]|nr:MEDS domain-containing protein [Deltaproteobacteria bacterium]
MKILRDSGINAAGAIKWGTHFCQLYSGKEDLLEVLVPYFKAGLEGGEFCMWITSDVLGMGEAKDALGAAVPDLERYFAKGQIEIMPHQDWYLKEGPFCIDRVLNAWIDKYREAEVKGFQGMRVAGDTMWIGEDRWCDFTAYEREVLNAIGDYRFIALCTYNLDKLDAAKTVDMVSNHHSVLIKRKGVWTLAENPERIRAREELLKSKAELEMRFRKRTAELFEANQSLQAEIFKKDKVEHVLRENLLLLQGLMDNSKAVIYIRDTEGRFLIVNKSLERAISRDRIVGLTPYDIFTKEISDELLKNDRKVIEAGTPFEFEEEVCLAGVTRIYLSSKFPIFDPSGAVRAVCGVSTDITERKRMEQALKKSEEGLVNAQRIARLGSWEWDLNENNVVWSDELYRIMGVNKEEFIVSSFEGFMDFVHPEDREDMKAAIDSMLLGKNSYNVMDYRIILADGAERALHAEREIAFDEAGKPVKISGFVQDITARKMIEAEKEKIQAQLFKSQKMEIIGKLSGGIAHEFNNLMVIIKLNSELAKRETDKNKQSAFFEEIRAASEQAENLTRQLLIFSRSQPIKFDFVDINGAVRDLTRILQRLISENIEIRTDFCAAPRPVYGDKALVEQLVMNLALNANDAMAGGGSLIIQTKNMDVPDGVGDFKGVAPGKFVCLTVADTGVGMREEVIQKAFEPFFSTKGTGKGIGLGLAVVESIVKEHKGHISIVSEPSQGSKFTVLLPAVSESRAGKTVVSGRQGMGERILLVEDEGRLRTIVALVLKKSGYNVFEAKSAADAKGIFQKEGGRFDLVFTDIILEDKNGIELINDLSLEGRIKVLFTSGYLDIKEEWPVIEEKGYKLLQKPYEMNELISAIDEALKN